MKVIILNTDDGYEALYIDGKLVDDGCPLGEGDSIMYMLKQSEKYGFKSSDVIINYLNVDDNILVSESGSFLSNISEYKGKY